MATPQQVGAAAAVSNVPVFYVPPPEEPINVFAAFWSSFLAARNPWARELFSARLRALDPNAKAAALLKAQALQNDMLAQVESTRRVQAQADASKLSALQKIIASENVLQASLVQSSIRGQIATLEAEESSRAREQIRTEAAEDLLRQVSDTLRNASSAFIEGDAATSRQLSEQASNELRRGLQDVTDPGEQLAISRRLRDVISTSDASRIGGGAEGSGGAVFRDFAIGRLGLPEQSERAPLPTVGIPSFAPSPTGTFAQQEFQRAIRGEAPPALRSETIGERIRTTVPGAAPTTPPAPGAAPTIREALEAAGQPPGAALPPTGISELRSQLERVFEARELGAIGDPIFTKDDPRTRIVQRFRQRGTGEEIADLLAGLQRAEESAPLRRVPGARAARRGIAQEQVERSLREGELVRAAGAVAAPVGQPDIERFVPQPRTVIQGEDTVITPRPSRRERRTTARAVRQAERTPRRREIEAIETKRAAGEPLTDEELEVLTGGAPEEEEEENEMARFVPRRRRSNG